MWKTIVAVALIASCLGVAVGWESKEYSFHKQCAYLDDGYKRLDRDAGRLPQYELSDIPEAVVGNIQKCWSRMPYAGPIHSLRLEGARRVSEGRYFVAFEADGVTDIQVVFLVDRAAGVLDAYEYGTLAHAPI